MPITISVGDPQWALDVAEIERQVAIVAKNNGITGQAQWTTFIANISTLAQALAVCRGLLTAVKCNAP